MKKTIVLLALATTFILGAGGSLTAEKVKIVVAGWPAGDKAFQAILPAFNAKFPDIEVALNFAGASDYKTQLATALAAGSGAADVVMIEQEEIGKYRDSTALENLRSAPYNADALKKDFVDYKWSLATSLDGKRLAGLVWDIGPASVFYRRDIFKEAGLPSEPADVEKLLSTWEGVLKAAKAVYIPKKRWLTTNAADLYTWNYMNRDYFNEKLEFNPNKPGVKDALNAAITMRKNGWDAKVGLWDNETSPAIANGSIAMVVAGCWYGGFLKSWVAPKTSGLWGVARLPGKIQDSNWGGSYLAIPSQGKHRDAAWKFVQFALATRESQNTMFNTVDYFPGYLPAWNDPLYSTGDPFFGGQKTKALWVDIAKNTKSSFSTAMDGAVFGILTNAVTTGLNNGSTAEQILTKVSQDVAAQTLEERDAFIELMKAAGRWK